MTLVTAPATATVSCRHPDVADPDRARLNVILSPEAHAGWKAFTDLHGVSVAALAEAIGLTLAVLAEPSKRLSQTQRDLVRVARQITAERKARG